MTSVPELLGESPAIRALRAEVTHLLGSSARRRRMPAILIQGETGTGKGLLARFMRSLVCLNVVMTIQ